MEKKKYPPVGIEFFNEFKERNFYYVDKTDFISTFLENPAKVTLFTRPRRFGKTLMMTMLQSFFQIGAKREDFEDCMVLQDEEACAKHLGKYPVIFLTLKGMEGNNYKEALGKLQNIIKFEVSRIKRTIDSDRLTMEQKQTLDEFAQDRLSVERLSGTLFNLTEFLHSYYRKKVVLLIDEYDVPLDKAFFGGYYGEMITFFRSFLGDALKTNPYLEFAVLTGCLRVSKESIFTGLNNFRTIPLSDKRFDRFFGFTEEEVAEMLDYYGITEQEAAVREWYDGYTFGNRKMYCPWDVVNFLYDAKDDPEAVPAAYWVNSSGNHILRKLIQVSGTAARRDIDALVQGKIVYKKITEELTYGELYDSEENIFSVLYSTGYLTGSGTMNEAGETPLVIPNKEIRLIFEEQIIKWFETESRRDSEKLHLFCRAFAEGDERCAETMFTEYLRSIISIRDTGVKKSLKENFYHGLLLGLLKSERDWSIQSNVEAGEGYADIVIGLDDYETGIVIEVKYAENAKFEEAINAGLLQTQSKRYADYFQEDGYEHIITYAVACYKKRCRIKKGE